MKKKNESIEPGKSYLLIKTPKFKRPRQDDPFMFLYYYELLETAGGTLKYVVELHAPKKITHSHKWECVKCKTVWPCRVIDEVIKALESLKIMYKEPDD